MRIELGVVAAMVLILVALLLATYGFATLAAVAAGIGFIVLLIVIVLGS